MRRLLFVLACTLSSIAGAQVATPAGGSTSSRSTGAAVPDSDATSASAVAWQVSTTGGALRFASGASERALGMTLGLHLWRWADLLVNPTFASATAPDTVIGGRSVAGRSVSGLTALPVGIGISHDIAARWHPSFSARVNFTIPLGDTAGVGASQAGYGLSLDGSVSPTEDVSFSLGVSHALNDAFSAGFATTSATSLSVGSWWQAGPVGLSASVSGDVAGPAAGYSPSRSASFGVGVPVAGDWALQLDASGGLTTGAPEWSFMLGFGTTSGDVASVALSPLARLGKAFGVGRSLTRSQGVGRGRGKP